MSPNKRGPKGTGEPKLVTAVLRALDLLHVLNDADDGMRLTDLSQQTNLSKATAYRLLMTLARRNLVEYRPDTERYAPGPQMLEYGLRRIHGLEVRRVALPHMRKLRDETLETVTLSLLVGRLRQYVEQLESPQEVRQTVELGRRVPLHAGGSGKAILAFLPPDRIEEYLQAVDWEPLTPNTIRDANALRQELACIRETGYAFSIQERQTGAASAAAPLFDRHGEVLGCLSISGPYQRFTPEAVARFGQLVKETARHVSRQMGWREDQHTGPR